MKSHKVTTISKLNFYYILYNIESYFSLVHLKVIAYFQVCLTFNFFFFLIMLDYCKRAHFNIILESSNSVKYTMNI